MWTALCEMTLLKSNVCTTHYEMTHLKSTIWKHTLWNHIPVVLYMHIHIVESHFWSPICKRHTLKWQPWSSKCETYTSDNTCEVQYVRSTSWHYMSEVQYVRHTRKRTHKSSDMFQHISVRMTILVFVFIVGHAILLRGGGFYTCRRFQQLHLCLWCTRMCAVFTDFLPLVCRCIPKKATMDDL